MNDFFLLLISISYFLQEIRLTCVKSKEGCHKENWVAVAEDYHPSSYPAFAFFLLHLFIEGGNIMLQI